MGLANSQLTEIRGILSRTLSRTSASEDDSCSRFHRRWWWTDDCGPSSIRPRAPFGQDCGPLSDTLDSRPGIPDRRITASVGKVAVTVRSPTLSTIDPMMASGSCDGQSRDRNQSSHASPAQRGPIHAVPWWPAPLSSESPSRLLNPESIAAQSNHAHSPMPDQWTSRIDEALSHLENEQRESFCRVQSTLSAAEHRINLSSQQSQPKPSDNRFAQ